MKKIIFPLSTLLIVLACNEPADKQGTTSNKADTAKAFQQPDSAKMAQDMKAWEDFAKPAEMHQWMAKHAGNWEADLKQWMGGPEPMLAKGTEEVKSIMNGLYLEANFNSTMMGQPMMGKSIMGFDKMKKQFVVSWIDNFGSGIVSMSGTYDSTSKTLNLKGKQSDPASGKETDIRQEQKWIDDNTYVMMMYGAGPDGKEMKFMEGTFKRKK